MSKVFQSQLHPHTIQTCLSKIYLYHIYHIIETAELLMNCQTSIEDVCKSPMTQAEEDTATSCETSCQNYKGVKSRK